MRKILASCYYNRKPGRYDVQHKPNTRRLMFLNKLTIHLHQLKNPRQRLNRYQLASVTQIKAHFKSKQRRFDLINHTAICESNIKKLMNENYVTFLKLCEMMSLYECFKKTSSSCGICAIYRVIFIENWLLSYFYRALLIPFGLFV